MKLIAELCQNHNGDINILKDMVVKSAESGADIVKIQSIKANSLTKREKYESFRKYSDEYQRFASLELSIDDELEFCQIIRKGLNEAKKGNLVTFGVLPTRPETGYGYIEAFEKLTKNTHRIIEN